ncbi:MAG: hypothetical protein KDB61_04800 [Planctomycetes bacterium]|nr:hypothetical protein [Planctomycetota bacterium]
MRTLLLSLFGSTILLACSSEPAPPAQDPSNETPPAQVLDAQRPLNFVAPLGWVEREPTQAMRAKEFVVGEAGENPLLVIVAHWPNGVGSLQDNLNRWKGQVGSDDPTLTEYTANGLLATVLDAEGTYQGMTGEAQEGSRLLAAYVESPAGRVDGVYTIKMSGSSEEVTPWVESFHEFIKGL